MHKPTFGFYVFVILWLSSLPLMGQEGGESPFAELRMELQFAESDSARIKIMINLCTKWGESRPDSGLKYCNMAQKLAKKRDQKKQLADAYWREASIHSILGNHSRQLDLNFEGLKIVESLRDTKKIAVGLMMVGNTYYTIGDDMFAMDYYQRSLSFSSKMGDEKRSAATLNNIGNIWLNQKGLDSALFFFNEALIINQKTRNQRWESTNLYNIGKVYLIQKDYESALENFRKSQDLKRDLNSRRGEAACYRMIGQTYLNWGKYSQAELALKKALSMYESIDSKPGVAKTYRLLSDLYTERGDLELAFENFKEFHQLDDSIKNENVLLKMSQTKQLYDMEKQAKADELANKQRELDRQLQLNRRTQLMYLSVFGSVVLLLGGFVAFKRARDQRKINANLEKVVEQRTEALQTANEELNLFIYKSSHDLKGPLASVQGLVMIADMEEGVDGIKNYLTMIDQKVGQLDTILQRLIDTIGIGDGIIEMSELNAPSLLEEVKSDLGSELQSSGVVIRSGWQGENIYSSRDMVKVMIFNLVQNAVRFADAKKKEKWCSVRTLSDDNGTIIEVADNGIGIENDLQKKVWNMFWRGHRDARGSGLGLYIVKKAIQRLGGTYEMVSQEGKGTTVRLLIPAVNQS